MTLEEISRALPNGFHDATLLELNMSYETRTIRMRLSLWVGLLSFPQGDERERAALVTLNIDEFQYCIVEAPVGAMLLDEHDLSTVDDRQWESDIVSLPKLGDGLFRFGFYVFNWMASIHLAAKSATMIFDDPEDERYVQRIMAEMSNS